MRIPTNAKFKNSKLCTFDTRRKETKKLSHSQKKKKKTRTMCDVKYAQITD